MVESGGISVHAIDVSRGVPANGLKLSLYRLSDTERVLVTRGVCGPTGTLDDPIADGEGIVAGLYEVEFEIGGYFRKQSIDVPEPAFLELVPFRFGIAAIEQHYHLPLKFTPWGFSLFRGGA